MSIFRRRYKCCVIGDFQAGKTSIIRAVLGKSLKDTQTTLGIDFFTTSLQINDTSACLSIWDTAGAERFRSLTHSYVRDSDIVIIVYDITKHDAMQQVSYWFRSIENIRPTVVAVVGNKNDLSPCISHDLYDTLEPYTRQNWKIITGTCSSRKSESVKKIFTQCLEIAIQPQESLIGDNMNIKIVTTQLPQRKCCT